MNINEIKQLTKGKQYNFLRDNEHLGKKYCSAWSDR